MFFTENEHKTNRLLMNILWVSSMVGNVSFLVNRMLNANTIPYSKIFFSFILSIILLILYEWWYYIFYNKGIGRKIFKYLLMLGIIIFTFYIMYMSKDPFMIGMYFFPIIAAALYYDNKLMIYSIFLSIVLIFVLISNNLIDLNFKVSVIGFYTDIFASLAVCVFLLFGYSLKSSKIISTLQEQENILIQINKELEKTNQELNAKQEELIILNQNLSTFAQNLEKAYNELKQAQIKLVQQEKMASLGQLVAGVAHEINTPVGTINCNIDISQRLVRDIEFQLENLNIEKVKDNLSKLSDINKINIIAIDRIVNIVKSLRSFARLDDTEFGEADIHVSIENSIVLLNNRIKDRIEVIREYGELPKVKCYVNEINQVFLNLLVNAVDAIPDKGVIWIKTYAEAGKVFIKIRDSGTGIKPEHLGKIFDPGFTTKGVGVGTGLGLSIVYNIIEKHKGEITVESEYGKGTEFTVELPVEPEFFADQ